MFRNGVLLCPNAAQTVVHPSQQGQRLRQGGAVLNERQDVLVQRAVSSGLPALTAHESEDEVIDADSAEALPITIARPCHP